MRRILLEGNGQETVAGQETVETGGNGVRNGVRYRFPPLPLPEKPSGGIPLGAGYLRAYVCWLIRKVHLKSWSAGCAPVLIFVA